MLCVAFAHCSRSTPLKNLLMDINRLVHPAQPLSSPEDSANLPDPRILILSVSPDASNSYIHVIIFSAQKLVSPIPSCYSARLLSSPTGTHHRCMQNLWPRFCLLSTGRVLHWRFLHLSRVPRSPTSVSHRPFALLYQFRPTHCCIPDVIFAYALHSQDHHCPRGRQDELLGRLHISQTRCRHRIRLFGLPFQFSSSDCAAHVPLPTFIQVLRQPVPVCSTCW